MKYNLFLLLFFTIGGYSQDIKYVLFLKDSCSNKTESSFSYHLERDGIKYSVTDFDTGSVLLPEKGEYVLFANSIGETHNILIDKKENSDTLEISRIQEYILTHKKPGYTFRKCDKLAEGNETGYYSDGSIRFKGEFKEGIIVGVLKRFYQNGKIKEISEYDKQGFLLNSVRFDEEGNRIEE